MLNIIDCKSIAQKVKDEVKAEVATMDTKPHLVVIQVGHNPASTTYVRNKERVCEEVGIRSTKVQLDESISQFDLEAHIRHFNDDVYVDGILLQLPLPKHLNEQQAINLIRPIKDVDGLTPTNAGLLMVGDPNAIVPCTPLGVMTILKETGTEIEGKNATVVGRSNLFGKPMAQLLLQANATVTTAHSRTTDVALHTCSSDIIIFATGQAKFYGAEYIPDDATIIDVGINRDEFGKLCGDANISEIERHCSESDTVSITPVPGGVGILTTATLMANVVKCAKMKNVK